MKFSVLTIPFNSETSFFEDKDMQEFLSSKKVVSHQAHFFTSGGKPYWTIFVEYEDVFDKSGKLPVFSEPERLLYEHLQKWRKEKAEKEGVPIFIIANNSELASLVQKAPKTTEGLRQIKGFGAKKTQKYGKEILEMLTAFYERQVNNSK
jgi:superfamily II DNA helicase RecQ